MSINVMDIAPPTLRPKLITAISFTKAYLSIKTLGNKNLCIMYSSKLYQ
jgi:hypothetical protein